MSKPISVWRVTASRSVVKDRWIDLRADDCVRDDGVRIAPYYVLSYPDWVHVVCEDKEGRICLVEQYRHGVGRPSCELPGGMLEAGETPLVGAMRELREETGLTGEDWADLGAFSPNPATHSNLIHVFYCRTDAKAGRQTLDTTEEISTNFATPDEVKALIQEGRFLQLNHVGILYRAIMAGRLNAGRWR